MSIIRVKHNRENPYVTLNKQALWNPRLSLKAIGLWAKCLSRPDDWKFHVKELATKGIEGRRAIYSAIDELEKERYVLKLKHYEKEDDGKYKGGGVEYIFFEFPYSDFERDQYMEEFKKCFRQCGFGNLHDGDLRDSTLLSNDPLPSTEEEKKSLASPPQPQAAELSISLLEAIQKTKPDLKKPNLDKWAQQIECMMKIDKRAYENIKKVIEWLPTDDFWRDKLLSAEKLRAKFDQLELKMRAKPSNSLKDDLESIKKLSEVKDIGSNPNLIIGATYVEFPYLKVYLKAGDKGFKEKLIECLRLNKMRQ